MSMNVIPNMAMNTDEYLKECMTEIESFVQDVFIDAAWSEYPEKMTDNDAQINIDEWKNEGVDLPEGLTAPVFADVWNGLIEEGFFK